MLLVYFIARVAKQQDPVLSLVFSWYFAIAPVCGSAISLMKILAPDPYTQLLLPSLFLAVGRGAINYHSPHLLLYVLHLPMLLGFYSTVLLRWRMEYSQPY